MSENKKEESFIEEIANLVVMLTKSEEGVDVIKKGVTILSVSFLLLAMAGTFDNHKKNG